MKNWKTSLSGLITGIAGIVVQQPQLFVKWPIVHTIAIWVMGGGLIAFGFATKDATTHSTVGEVQAATDDKVQDALDAVNAPPKN